MIGRRNLKKRQCLKRHSLKGAVMSESLNFELATRDSIGNLVIEYNRLAEQYAEISAKVYAFGLAAKTFMNDRGSTYALEECLKKCLGYIFRGCWNHESDGYKQREDLAFINVLRTQAWDALISQTRFRSLVSSNMERDFEQWRKSNGDMPFNEENIGNLFDSLMASKDDILRQCILNAFDLMTRYHEGNRAVLKGYKTNEAWRVNRKVILPGYISSWYGLSLNSYRLENVYDIDRAMAALNGQLFDDIPLPIWKSVEEHCRSGNYESGQPFDSTFFTLRAYRCGSLHLCFKDEDLLTRFNRIAAEGKNWLPDAKQR